MQQMTQRLDWFVDRESAFRADPDRATKYAAGLDDCDLPLVGNAFDAGISTHTLEHIQPE